MANERPSTHKNNGDEDQPVERDSQRFSSKPFSGVITTEEGEEVDTSEWKGMKYVKTEQDAKAIACALSNKKMSIKDVENLPMMKEALLQSVKIPVVRMHKLNEFQRLSAMDEFEKKCFAECKGYEPKKERKLTIFIGYPASGKSKTISQYANPEKGYMQIDNDWAKQVPVLNEWYQNGIGAGAVVSVSSQMQEQLLSKLMPQGYNMVIPMVCSWDGAIKQALYEAQKNGYEIEIIQKEEDPEICAPRLVKRMAEEGRFVSPFYLESCTKECPKVWKKLKEEFYENGTVGGVRINGYKTI